MEVSQARGFLFLVVLASAALGTSCMAPGGSVDGRFFTDTGQPIAEGRVVIDFRDGTSFQLGIQEGRYGSAWSHGSWRGSVVRAEVPGRQGAQARIGWDHWTCDFRLAPENAPAGASKADCAKAH